MKLLITTLLIFTTVFGGISQVNNFESNGNSAFREHIRMDSDWRFALGHASDYRKDFSHGTSYFTYYAKTGYGDGAAAYDFEDRSWRIVDLPHDWAVELPFSETASHSHGYKTIGWKYPETSVGWYRKMFFIPESDKGRKISIQFDGIYRDAKVWVNGFYVGHEASGYSSTNYDITDYLNFGNDNVVAVRVDASLEEGWFYEGAGIYRHVWLNKTDRLHIAQNGTFITSEVHDNYAVLTLRSTVENQYTDKVDFVLKHIVRDESGKAIASSEFYKNSLRGNFNQTYFNTLRIENPRLWSLEDPNLYKIETQLISDNKILDSYETTIGIRTIQFDADKGFFLNGKSVKIKGVNNHQDHAGVGTAIPDALQEYRILQLKEMGCNAIRTAHNPATPELLDICDRLGMLVMEENRLMGINKEHFDLLERFMKRDRNHPSIIIWSLGNEEWAIEGNEKGAMISSSMQQFAQTIDSSRFFTLGASGGWDTGSGTVSQVMGYNYIFHGNIDEHHRKFPLQASVGTEESNTIGTRGIYVNDFENGHMKPTNLIADKIGTEFGWKFYAERPFLSGLFFWTGFDYRGEPNPMVWPAVNSQFGIIDLCGYPKDIFYYLKSWWTDKPTLYISPHWNWEGHEGKYVKLTIYSNADEVNLSLNGKNLGKKTMPKNGHLEWDIKYKPGVLLASGYRNSKLIASNQMETTGAAENITLQPDKENLKANGQDIAVITVKVNDKKRLMVPDADNEISFSIEGPAEIMGVGNGDPASHDPEKFVDHAESLSIENLKILQSVSYLNPPEIENIYSKSDWKPAFQKVYGEYDSEKNIIIKADFLLEDFSDQTIITLYAKSLAENQSIHLNGKLLAENIKRNSKDQVFILDHSWLKNGKNELIYQGKPFVKQFQWEEISTDPGIIGVYNPAAQWKRKAFNGLAQVLLKTTGESGEISLTATSPGLKPAFLKLNSTSTKSRPFIAD
ncbi:MAG: DUF4982 domain-containing protein [Bacteroidales bacterium]|nr:DUF4982 domain-containing protein [Bacteroidales bacterium]MCF8390376.1 DUF4982 domain-containing protein [Bacteroidales bacterium]